MALLDVAKAAEYGLKAQYLDKMFRGEFSLGSINVNYTNSCASKNTWGTCQSATQTRNQPATFSSATNLKGSGATINGSSWLAKKAPTAQTAYAILRNTNSNNPANVSGGVKYSSGNWGNSNTDKGVGLYFDLSNFNAGGITFIDNNSATVGTGQVTTSSSQLAAGGNASSTFVFLPGASTNLTLEYQTSNTIDQTTTQGTTNSSSSSQSVNLGISNKTSVGGTIGVVNVSNETTISAAYENAWSTQSSVEFSKSSGSSKTSTSTVTVGIDLSNLQQQPDGTYNYTPADVEGSPSGSVSTPTVNFVPGKRYKAVISYNQATVETTVTGTYDIGGSIGSIKDNHGNSIAAFGAAAISYADNHAGPQVLNYPEGSVGKLASNQTTIPFNGSAVFATSLQTSFSTNFYDVASTSSALVSSESASSLGLKNVSGNVVNYDLALLDNSYSETGAGNWLSLETLDGDMSTVSGNSSGSNVVEASPDGTHKFINHTKSYLYGNDNKDTFVFGKNDADNVVDARGGDDSVVSSSGQSVDLGDGNDTYKIKKGGLHQITLGEGHDHIIITGTRRLNFHITDFDYIDDTILLSDKLDASLFDKELVNSGDTANLNSAYIQFKYDGENIGTAIPDRDSYSYSALKDPNKHFELAFLNSKYYDDDSLINFVKDGGLLNPAELFDSEVIKGGLLEEPTVSPMDWADMSNRVRSGIVYDAMSTLGSEVNAKQWKRILNSAGESSVQDFSLDMIEKEVWPFSGLAYADLV